MRTTLTNAINSASLVLVDGIEIDCFEVTPEGTETGPGEVAEQDVHYLSMEDGGLDYEWVFHDQEVEIDSDGDCYCTAVDGELCRTSFRVTHPMKAADLCSPTKD